MKKLVPWVKWWRISFWNRKIQNPILSSPECRKTVCRAVLTQHILLPTLWGRKEEPFCSSSFALSSPENHLYTKTKQFAHWCLYQDFIFLAFRLLQVHWETLKLSLSLFLLYIILIMFCNKKDFILQPLGISLFLGYRSLWYHL